MQSIKIISWNVNGIRSVLKKEEFQRCLTQYDPDIICVQETKAQQYQVEWPHQILEKYPHRYWCDAQKKGYSGVLTMSKIPPLESVQGFHTKCNTIDCDYSRTEGRVISTRWPWGWLVNVYTPNSKMDLSRLNYRTQQWDKGFARHCEFLTENSGDKVVICGDLNVAHTQQDVWSPTCKGPGLTPEERSSFTDHLLSRFIDSYRYFYPDKRQYTWWSNMGRARNFNKGWRLDYFMVQKELMSQVKDSVILDQQWGSDHCPIQLTITE